MREHLLAAVLIMKSFTGRGRSVPIVLCDVKKCFDKLVLTDLVFDLTKTGAGALTRSETDRSRPEL